MSGKPHPRDAALARTRVLVTGATGFIGSHLVARLTAAGAMVHAIRRRPIGTRIPAGALTWHDADVTDARALARAVDHASPDIVFHLAAAGTTYDQQDAERIQSTNVGGALNLWAALDDRRCRVVMTGSCGEYGESEGRVREDHACAPTWWYPATVHAAVTLLTTLARQSARELVVLRPFGPYGPADNADRVLPRVIDALLGGGVAEVTAGEQLRDYSFVADHVDALVAAAVTPGLTPGAIYNVGSGRPIRLRDLLVAAADAVGSGARDRIRFGAVPYRRGEIRNMCADPSAAARDLHVTASTPLDDGLAATVAWHRQLRETAARSAR